MIGAARPITESPAPHRVAAPTAFAEHPAEGATARISKATKRGRGRPVKPLRPPGAPLGSAALHQDVTIGDVNGINAKAGLKNTPATDAVVAGINEALTNYALWRDVHESDATNAQKRDWCAAAARQAHDLLEALGGSRGSPADLLLTLDKGWTTPEPSEGEEETEEHRRAAADLEYFLLSPLRKVYDRFLSSNWREVAARARKDIPWLLFYLANLAARAETYWGKEVKRGGGSVDDPRDVIMRGLVSAFHDMTGRWPKQPTGDYHETPDILWFVTLFQFAKLGELTAAAGKKDERYPLIGWLKKAVRELKRQQRPKGA